MMKVQVANWQLHWLKAPHGTVGTAVVDVAGEKLEVRWSRDGDGIWVEFPYGVFGYDFIAEQDDDGRTVYQIRQRHSDQAWAGVALMRAGEQAAGAGAGGKKKAIRVRAQMPGKIVRILVQPGASVEKGQALLVMEAMKMENQIVATQAGKVNEVKVKEGQAVETGADLMMIGSADA